MKSTSLLLLLVALTLPTSTEAILVEIFNFFVSIFFPDWQGQLCDALIGNIPESLSSSCGCEIDLSGLFDFGVTGLCDDVGGLPCDISLGADGNIFAAVFSGVQLTVGTECDLDVLGSVDLSGGGTLGVGGSDIDSCSLDYDPPLFDDAVGCDCAPGCDPSEPFAVGVSCDFLGIDVLTLDCVNILEIITTIANLPPPVPPPGFDNGAVRD